MTPTKKKQTPKQTTTEKSKGKKRPKWNWIENVAYDDKTLLLMCLASGVAFVANAHIALPLSKSFMHFEWWNIFIYLCKDDFMMKATKQLDEMAIRRSKYVHHIMVVLCTCKRLFCYFSRHKYFMFHALLSKWQWIQDVWLLYGCCLLLMLSASSVRFVPFHKSKKVFHNEKCSLLVWKLVLAGINVKREKLNVSLN